MFFLFGFPLIHKSDNKEFALLKICGLKTVTQLWPFAVIFSVCMCVYICIYASGEIKCIIQMLFFNSQNLFSVAQEQIRGVGVFLERR